ncbi:type IX secretion system outer membrane channel protein PorV [Crocinitomicaceae bacterium]|nr:type IX secretion system outer membrane channel protein PorV [Crocinitomicaceae bacterium]
MNKKHIIALALSLVGLNASAQSTGGSDLQLNTITSAVPFLQITPDSRSGAMGDVGTALSPSSSSLFWNTSMLSFTEEDMEISLSYSPWLQQIARDINLSHLSGYKRINDRNVIGGSLRFFSLGEIVFTDETGNQTLVHVPNELELLAGYSYKLNDKFALGLNGKFIYSNLTAGIVVAGAQSKAGLAGAADVSFSYVNDDVNFGGAGGRMAFGATLNNLGNKISYTELDDRDFLPTNLKLGSAMTFDFDNYNVLTWAVDVSKLLVPTPPAILTIGGTPTIVSGYDPNVGVVPGMLQSFYDAPGALTRDENGDFVENSDGTYQVEDGSKLREELTEIMIGTGAEYWYNNVFAVRGGYFYENLNKGARQHLTFGIGLKYNMFGIDFSYLTSLRRNSPLQNTIRFTLRLHLGGSGKATGSVKPE